MLTNHSFHRLFHDTEELQAWINRYGSFAKLCLCLVGLAEFDMDFIQSCYTLPYHHTPGGNNMKKIKIKLTQACTDLGTNLPQLYEDYQDFVSLAICYEFICKLLCLEHIELCYIFRLLTFRFCTIISILHNNDSYYTFHLKTISLKNLLLY